MGRLSCLGFTIELSNEGWSRRSPVSSNLKACLRTQREEIMVLSFAPPSPRPEITFSSSTRDMSSFKFPKLSPQQDTHWRWGVPLWHRSVQNGATKFWVWQAFHKYRKPEHWIPYRQPLYPINSGPVCIVLCELTEKSTTVSSNPNRSPSASRKRRVEMK